MDIRRRSLLGWGLLGAGEAAAIAVSHTGLAHAADSAVLADEKMLTAQGYYCGVVDGVADTLYSNAVMAFQKANGLPRTGAMSAATRQLLASTPRRFATTNLTGAAYLEVDLSQQTVKVVAAGRVYATMSCSTGDRAGEAYGGRNTIRETPKGIFYLRQATEGWESTRFGNQYRPSRFLADFAIYGGSTGAKSMPSTYGGIMLHPHMWRRLIELGYGKTSTRLVITA